MAKATPPTGTVTFLFTDIEGSTALYENHPDQMQPARKRHDDILRSSIESHGGYVFKTVGDAFCAAFPTAREAVQATLASQRALLAERWPENTKLRVRMGLHTGVAEESEGDYFGPPVNRVARLMSTGHGGQVLLSDATHNLVRDALTHMEPEARLRYLGEHRLKDLRYTERIFQLVVPDLPKEFEPLRTHGLITPEEVINLDRRYRRIRYLGGGGFGNVYLVHHEALGRDMALKVLGQQYAEDEQFKERFKREAKSAASLNHPNVVQVYDAGEGYFDGQKASYITMEYVPGGTLEDLIAQQGGPLPARTATELTLQVARALEAAHRSGVIHRDIKPQNILITELGEAKVADFGIARAAASSTKLTRTGLLMGTLHYMSPEQANGKPASPRSDLYSLGVVLYQALTEQLPFDAETPAAIMVKHITEPLHPPKEVNPDVPEGINELCVRLLAKNPDDRHPDAANLIEDLERVQRSPESTASTKTVPDEEDAAFADTILDEEEDPAFAETILPGRTEAPSTVEVPDLSGQDASQAGYTLANVGLKLGRQNEAPSETAPKGEIIGQYPLAQTEVERGSSVSVAVSSGPKRARTAEQPEQTKQHRRQAQQTRARERQRAGQARYRQQAEEPTTTAPDVGSEQQDRQKRKATLSAAAVVFAGVAWTTYGVLPPLILLVSGVRSLNFPFDTIAEISMLGGLVGLHLRQAPTYGKLGLAGFLVTFIGITLALLGIFTLVTADIGIVLVGFMLLGVATLRTRVLPRWCGVALLILPVLSSFGAIVGEEFIRPVVGAEIVNGPLMVGLIWLALGYTLWSQRNVPSGLPEGDGPTHSGSQIEGSSSTRDQSRNTGHVRSALIALVIAIPVIFLISLLIIILLNLL